MESIESELKICSNCQHEIALSSNFCRICGQAQHVEELELSSGKRKNLKQIALFFAIELIFCAAALIIKHHTVNIALFFDVTMAISTIIFFSYQSNWQENKFLLNWPNFSFPKLLGLIILTIIASGIVQFLVGHLNSFVFNKRYTFYFTYATHQYGNYIMILSVAIFPALFEELAYRGFLMQKLLKVVDQKEAIYITSILFFFIHFSMISFFWMLPFAFLLAYTRIRTNTLWYGVVMHFFFNLTACAVEIYTYGGLMHN